MARESDSRDDDDEQSMVRLQFKTESSHCDGASAKLLGFVSSFESKQSRRVASNPD